MGSVVRQLLPSVGRRIPAGAIAFVGAIGAIAVALSIAINRESAALLVWLRLSVVMLAAAGAGCINDPPEAATDTMPFGRPRRRWLAAGLTFCVAATVLIVLGSFASMLDRSATVPIGGLLVELLALSTVGWSLCALVINLEGHHRAGPSATTGLVLLVAVTMVSPRLMHTLWVGPGPEWNASHVRWAWIAVVASAGCLVMSRDPLARLVVRRR